MEGEGRTRDNVERGREGKRAERGREQSEGMGLLGWGACGHTRGAKGAGVWIGCG